MWWNTAGLQACNMHSCLSARLQCLITYRLFLSRNNWSWQSSTNFLFIVENNRGDHHHMASGTFFCKGFFLLKLLDYWKKAEVWWDFFKNWVFYICVGIIIWLHGCVFEVIVHSRCSKVYITRRAAFCL